MVRLPFLLGLAIAATPAIAQDTRWRQAASCISASDRAICWLGQLIDSPQVNMDPELARAPAVLEALGVALIAAEPQLALPDPDVPEEMRLYVETLSQSAQAIGTERPVADVIAIVRALPVSDPPFLANPLQDQTLSFGRLDAYAMLSGDEIAGTTPVLQEALLAAWEEDIPPDLDTIINSGPASLADALMQRGDKTGAERVLRRLSPGDAPAAISEMTRHGLLDAAYDLARSATVSDRTRGRIKTTAAMDKRAAAYLERLKPEMDAAMEAALAEFSAEDRALMLAQNFEEPEPEPAEDAGAIARSELSQARIDVMNAAAAAGRDDIALPLATEMFDAGLVGDDETTRSGLVSSLPVLINPAVPDAFERMAAAEARLETLADGGPDMPLGVVYHGWMRLGRTDRADAVLERWRPIAERLARRFRDSDGTDAAENQRDLPQALVGILIDRDDVAGAEALGLMPPTAPIDHDIARGVGISRLDERLSGRNIDDKVQILMSCSGRSLDSGALRDAESCAVRLADIADAPAQRLSAAELLLPIAQRAARADDGSKAEALLVRALQIGAQSADSEGARAMFSFQLDSATIDVSKALLRGDGRLPPTRPVQDVVR